MKNLLYKEINLCLNPLNYFFLGFAAMLLIPHYPVYIGFFYMCLSVFWIFNNSLINKDSLFNILLPISKNNIVKARCLLVALYEIFFILLSIPFAFLHNKFFPDGNPTGINANIAFFGLLLISISAFNFIFITKVYKKTEKIGGPFLLGGIAFLLLYILFDVPFIIKDLFSFDLFRRLDSSNSQDLGLKLIILFVGIVIYSLSWFATYKVSCKNFKKVDL